MTDCKNLDLAREWAEWVHDNPEVYGGTSDRARAAADVVDSLPEVIVDGEKLREVVADHHIDMSEELMEALGALLPAPTPPTLADMTPEEREACVGMQADVESVDDDYRSVIAYVSETVADIVVIGGRVGSAEHSEVTPLPDLPRMVWPGNEPGNVQVNRMDGLARTGETSPAETSDNRRSSTARTHPESAAPESASPCPEDVPVGEPWQVETYGQAAIGYRNDPESRICWAVVYRDEAGHDWMYDSDVTLIARLVPETTEQDDEPEFDPAYTYRDEDGSTWTYYAANNMWICRGSRGWHVRADSVPPTRFGPYTRIEEGE